LKGTKDKSIEIFFPKTEEDGKYWLKFLAQSLEPFMRRQRKPNIDI